MKKISLILTLFMTAAVLAGCGNSNKAETEVQTQASQAVQPPEGAVVVHGKETKPAETTKYETQPYVIPEGATGPADVTVAPRTDIPEDKRKVDEGTEIQVRYFFINSKGLNEEFDLLVNEECNAETLNALLVRLGVLAEDTQVLSFESDGTDATLTLNKLEGLSSYATEELLAQAIANTYTDNLFLDTLTVKVGDKTYGPLEYDSGKKK